MDPDRIKKYISLHRFSVLLACMTLLLVTVGGLVHSAGAGLSVPDWPTTYGENMFTFPLSKWKGGIKFEHGHRLLASFVGFLMVIELIWVWMLEKQSERRWLRNLAVVGFLTVCIQGLFGGATVLLGLPTWTSVCHALFAESFLIMTVALAMGTSPRWLTARKRPTQVSPKIIQLLKFTFGFTFVQIMMGAITRHTYSGLAIPDFPLANGKIIPDFVTFNVTIHFMHRMGALILSVLIFTQGIKIWRAGSELAFLRTPATILMGLVLVQIYLGAQVIWTAEQILPNTLHVGVGASIFAMTFITFFRSIHYYEFIPVQEYDMPAQKVGSLPGNI